MRQLYELADSRSLPAEARGEDGAWRLRMRVRHHVQVPNTRVSRASDEDAVALLRACRSARDRLLVLVLCRAGLRRSEAMGLRRDRKNVRTSGNEQAFCTGFPCSLSPFP
jgi:integrase/recombinase XerD